MSISITTQDRQLLTLVSKGEAVAGGNPYISLWPNDSEPSITQMTLAQVDRFQTDRKNIGFASTAIGKYQFIQRTLREAVGLLGVDPLVVRFNAHTQDSLILTILKEYRGYNDWLSGSLPTERFMINLAREFASMPVPYDMQGHSRPVSKGQSYYAGDGLNRASHNPDTLYIELEDILGNAAGTTSPESSEEGNDSGEASPDNPSPKQEKKEEYGGSGAGAGSGGHPGSQPSRNATLPVATDVYMHDPIDPLDDRYDFRTGKKIKDLLLRGTESVSEAHIVSNNVGPASISIENTGEPPSNVETNLSLFDKNSAPSVNVNETFNSELNNSVLTHGELITSDLSSNPSYLSSSSQLNLDTSSSNRLSITRLTNINKTPSKKELPKN